MYAVIFAAIWLGLALYVGATGGGSTNDIVFVYSSVTNAVVWLAASWVVRQVRG